MKQLTHHIWIARSLLRKNVREQWHQGSIAVSPSSTDLRLAEPLRRQQCALLVIPRPSPIANSSPSIYTSSATARAPACDHSRWATNPVYSWRDENPSCPPPQSLRQLQLAESEGTVTVCSVLRLTRISSNDSQCDESGPPCRSCAALDIPCTFQRPTKRRGPPNRHAEAIKKQRYDQTQSPTDGHHFEHEMSSSPPRLSIESICPLPTLQLLIDDYFTYIHPLIPLPHEPTFRMQLERRDDLVDKSFLALVANMVASLVASFPRRPRQLLNTVDLRRRFPNAGVLVHTCLQVADEARGPSFLAGPLTIYDAIASYLSAISYAYIFDFKRCRLFHGQSVLIMRILNIHRPSQNPVPATDFTGAYYNGADGAPHDSIDYVHEEMCRRLFWVSYVSSRHLSQFGTVDADLLFPPLASKAPPPPLPLEIDDAYISKTHITEQPAGFVSELTGFNSNINATTTWDDFVAMDAAVGLDEFSDINKQKRLIAQCVRNVKRATASLPPELVLNPASEGGWPSLENRFSHSRRDEPWSWQDEAASADQQNPYTRRRIQFEIQKANIYSTQLATRSYLVEQYWERVELQDKLKARKAVDSNQDPALEASEPQSPGSETVNMEQQEMANERDEILRDLSILLSSVNQVNMEPNGGSFVSASTRSMRGNFLEICFG